MILEKSNNGEKSVIFAGEEDEVYAKMYELTGRYIVNDQFNLYAINLGLGGKTDGVYLRKDYNGTSYSIDLKVREISKENK